MKALPDEEGMETYEIHGVFVVAGIAVIPGSCVVAESRA
jgi:hypothetical protein